MSNSEEGKPFNPDIDYYPPSLVAKYGIQLSDNAAFAEAQPPTADIGWEPDLAKFQRRTAERHRNLPQDTRVPKGWPEAVRHPLAWTGADLKHEDYVIELSSADIGEMTAALSNFKSLGLELHEVRKATFPLPLLGPRLESASRSVHDGIGFSLVRGLDSAAFSREDNVILYLGMSSYFGEQRGRQNQDGDMMMHITDVKFDDVPDAERRPVFTNVAQPFHTDLLCGVLAMYVLDRAAIGGNILLASSWTVYNEIASERPDLIHELSKSDWVHDTFGRNPLYHRRPLLHYWQDKLALIYSRRNLTGSAVTPRNPAIPPMTDAQADALDAVHFAATANHVSIEPRRGDMLFANNLAILHSRGGFEDSPDAKRYIIRLWLNNPELGWDVPPGLRLGWDRIFAGVDEISERWDLDPYGGGDDRTVQRTDDDAGRGRQRGKPGGGGNGSGSGSGSGGGGGGGSGGGGSGGGGSGGGGGHRSNSCG